MQRENLKIDQKISVIIPVYNAEEYLLPTLNVVRFQTYENLEIICVLDCPTDGSAKIAAEAVAEDKRIKLVIHSENRGMPAARNSGVENVTGAYIHFMDAGDLINYDFYEVLLEKATKTDADVCACSVINGYKPKQSIWFRKDEVFLGNEKIQKSEVFYRGWAWRYLIKKSFWEQHDFSFPDIVPFQDTVVTISILHHANKVAVCMDAVYFYKNRDSSSWKQNESPNNPDQISHSKKNFKDVTRTINNLIKEYKIKQPLNRFLSLSEYIKGKCICANDPITYGELKNKVSVVIPVYNVEKYLVRALNSVRFQTLENLEIICVLDCPTDRSAEIASKIAAEDKRIKLVKHSENKGLPAARNTGVKYATGEYLHFMDSDDWLSPDFYESLLFEAEKSKSDVTACSVYYEKKQWRSIWFRKSEVLQDIHAKMKKTEITIQGWAWRYLIKKSFWDERNFTFPDLVPMEDKPVMISMIYYANSVALCPAAVYFYKNRENSLTNRSHNAFLEKQRSENRHKARAIYKDFMKKNKIKQEFKLRYYLRKYIF